MFRTILAAGVVGGAAISLDARNRAFLAAASDSQMDVSAEVADMLHSVATELLTVSPTEGMASMREGMKAISGRLDIKTAMKAVAHKNLPTDVQAMVRTASTTKKGEFTEESMAKARIALNDMVEAAWVELDDKIIECK